MVVIMTEKAFKEFVEVREAFRSLVETMSQRMPWLAEIQNRMRLAGQHQDYAIETPIVFNNSLDQVTRETEFRFVIVADNPGIREQSADRRSYLVGHSGVLAEGWFRRELELDFRKSTVILNKTPVHTPRTAELAILLGLAGEHRTELAAVIAESQRNMAGLAFRLHAALGIPVWVSGYSELAPGKLFDIYAQELKRLYGGAPAWMRESLWLFRHFSMNQFSIEMKKKRMSAGVDVDAAEESTTEETRRNATLEALRQVGSDNRRRILDL